jgi:hypothetical protein
MPSFVESVLASMFAIALLICYGWAFLVRSQMSIIAAISLTVLVIFLSVVSKKNE